MCIKVPLRRMRAYIGIGANLGDRRLFPVEWLIAFLCGCVARLLIAQALGRL